LASDRAALVAALGLPAALLISGAAAARQIRVHEPTDLAFGTAEPHDNPFAVRFEAECVGPNGESLLLPGFYDGAGTYKVRFAATEEGEWRLTTRSDDPALDGKVVNDLVAVASPASHGRLRIDPAHPRRLAYEDGTPFFLMGYECDWLWALDLGGDESLPTLLPFLDKLAASGFSYVVMNAYAHDCGWRQGRTEDEDYGPPAVYAWAGTNEAPDHSRMNLAYWRHYDRVIAAMAERGLVAHIMVKVYNKMVSWPERRSEDERRYFRWLIARYAAYPDIVWDFSKESYNEPDLAYKRECLRYIRDTDPYGHLVTVHDDDGPYDAGDYDDLLDYQSDQNHDRFHERILEQSARREWPIVNIEFGYEHGPGGGDDMTYGVAQPAEEVLDRAWRIYMAGAYANYYYTYTAWDVVRTKDTPPGYAMMARLRAFFEGVRFAELAPADELVDVGYCLADPRREYVVYAGEAAPITLTVEAEGELPVRWYRCLTGEWADGGTVGAGAAKLVPPEGWSGPVAAVVGG
jgi:hypothetical protein